MEISEEKLRETLTMVREIRALVVEITGHCRLALIACNAALEYDAAIQACANDPDKMATYCTAQGETLDELYAAWIGAARLAVESIITPVTREH